MAHALRHGMLPSGRKEKVRGQSNKLLNLARALQMGPITIQRIIEHSSFVLGQP